MILFIFSIVLCSFKFCLFFQAVSRRLLTQTSMVKQIKVQSVATLSTFAWSATKSFTNSGSVITYPNMSLTGWNSPPPYPTGPCCDIVKQIHPNFFSHMSCTYSFASKQDSQICGGFFRIVNNFEFFYSIFSFYHETFFLFLLFELDCIQGLYLNVCVFMKIMNIICVTVAKGRVQYILFIGTFLK